MLNENKGVFVVCTWAVLICAYNLFLSVDVVHYVVDFMFHSHNIQFVFGMLAAYILKNWNYREPRVIVIIGFLMTFFSMSLYDEIEHLNILFQKLIWGICFSVLIIGSVLCERKSRVRAWNLLGVFGKASYSIYLIHTIIITACISLFSDNSDLLFMSGLVGLSVIAFVSIGISILFSKLIEFPLLKRGARIISKYE